MGNVVGVFGGKLRIRGARSVKFVISHYGRIFGRSARSVKFSVSNHVRAFRRGFGFFGARGIKLPVNFLS